eukprot:12092662-Prorocentrum_lima.AAC.1
MRDPFSANADYEEDAVARIQEAIDNESPCFSHRGQWAVRFAWPTPRGVPEDIALMPTYTEWTQYIGQISMLLQRIVG